MFLRDRLMELLGGGEQPQRQMKQAKPMRAVAQGVARGAVTPAQRDFPNKTNYGVAEDNMIDTPEGYITPQQYNALKTRPMYGRHLQDPVEGEGVNPIQMQNYGTNDMSANIQGVQNYGFTPMQGGRLNYDSKPQPAAFRNVQQDPYGQYRRIRF